MPKSSPFPSSNQDEEQEEKLNKLFKGITNNKIAKRSLGNSPV